LSDKQSTVISGSPPNDPFLDDTAQSLDTSPPKENLVDNHDLNKLESTLDNISHQQQKETLIDEDLLPKGALEAYNAEQKNRPPIPLQTYLWEEVKRAKEQVSDNVCNPTYPRTSKIS
jgi:hypothetical protein